ncbi:obscurin-like protein 1 isoform X2 [Protopterus annectens]|uniref:obscurin-like protein 1 isoform X2 n=1 Tax=Protopterus annectens TaxID=7888 RepID=UPI001CFAA75F|nr:obscurin-like protein 1 isoform X2 [Protopterus annectens]
MKSMELIGGAPRFLTYPRTFTFPSGTDAILKCEITGDPRPTVIWERGKEPIISTDRYQVLEDGSIYSLLISHVTAEDSGQYTCKAKNSTGESYALATLKVEEPEEDNHSEDNKPTFLIKPLSVKVNRGDNVTFTCKLSGKPRPVIFWEKDGKKLHEIFESTHYCVGCEEGIWHYLKIFNARLPDGGVYVCRARNNFGETLAAAVLLVEPVARSYKEDPVRNCFSPVRTDGPNLNYKRHEQYNDRRQRPRYKHSRDAEYDPRTVQQNGELTHAPKAKVFSVSEGKHAKFRCYVTGKPKPEIIWKKDGRLVTPGRRHLMYEDREGYFILKVLYCKQQDSGLYICAASNTAGQTLSSVQLNVKEPLLKFQSPLRDVEVSEKEKAVLECEVPSDSIPAIWYLEDKKLLPSTKYIMEEQGVLRRLTICDVTTDDDGIYLCEMADGGRSIAEVSVKGKITKKLCRKLDVLEGENAAFCVETDEETDEVHWYKDGEELEETHKAIMKSFGKTHILVMVNVIPEDSGLITFKFSDSSTSSQLRVKSLHYSPPSSPVGVKMNTQRGNAALLTWFPASDAKQNSATSYIIERQESGMEEWVQCLTTDSASTVEILGDSVPAEGEYKFRICALNKYGKSGHVEFPGAVHLVPVARILTPLKDTQVTEGEDIQFTIELSASVMGTWFLNGVQLQEDKKHAIKHSRTHHSLLIRNVQIEEHRGEIIFVAYGVRDSAVLSVKVPPVNISKLPAEDLNKKVIPFEPVVLYCELSRPDVLVRWFKDGKEVLPGDDISIQSSGKLRRLIINSAKPSDSGQYACDAVDDIMNFNVNVTDPPVQIMNKGDETHYEYMSSDRVVLTCQLSRASANMKWYKDDVEITDSENITIGSDGIYRRLIIHSATKDDTGEYVCDAVDDSMFFDVIVTDPTVKILNPFESTVQLPVLTHEQVVLECEVSWPKAEVRWYKDGLETDETENLKMEADGCYRRLIIPCATTEDTGEYIFDTGDDMVTFNVKVSEPPVKIIRNNSVPAVMKAFVGDALTLQCEISRPNAVVKWFKDGLEITDNRNVLVEEDGVNRRLILTSAKLEDNGTYICDVTDDVAKFIVQVTEPPVKVLRRPGLRTDYRCSASDDIVLEFELSREDGQVKWYKDGEKIADNERFCLEEEGAFRSLVILNTEACDSGEYLCDTVDDSIVFHVTVEEPPVSIVGNTGSPEHHSLVASDDLVLACEVSRCSARVKWYKDGLELVPNERITIEAKGLTRQLVISGAQPCDSGTYTCDAVDDKMVTTVTVEELPVKILNKEDTKRTIDVMEGETLTLSMQISRENASVQWLKNWRQLTSGGRIYSSSAGKIRTLNIKQAELTDSGVFTCDAGDDEAHFTVLVKEVPVKFVNKQDVPAEITVIENSNAVLSAVVSKDKGNVKWYRHRSPIPESGDKYEVQQDGRVHSLMVMNVLKEDSGMYTCVSHDDEMVFNITVKETPLMFAQGLYDICGYKDETVTFRCELCKLRGDVLWLKDGKEIMPSRKHIIKAEGRERSLTIAKIGKDDSGTYTCESKDDRTSGNLVVEIPRIVEFIAELHNVTVLEGEHATFKCMVSLDDVNLKWRYRGSEIVDSDKFLITRTRLNHALTIRNCQLCDSGRVTADAEGLVSEANLQVQESHVLFVKKLDNITVEEMQDVTLEIEISKETGEVQWMKQGVIIQPGTKFLFQESGKKRSLVIQNVTFADRGNYRCETLHDKTQCKLTIEPRRISIRKPMVDIETFEKEAVTFQVELSHPNVEGMWLKDGIRVKPNNNWRISVNECIHSLTLSALTLEDSGTISFNADTVRSSARLTVKEPPITFLKELNNVSVPESIGAAFEVEVSRQIADVKWYKDGEEIKPGKVGYRIYSMGRKRILQITKCKMADAGTYMCDASDCKSSAKLQVFEREVRMVKHLEDVDICENENAVFMCEVSHDTVKAEWYKNGERIKTTSTTKIRQEGTKHFLLICNVKAEDAGEIMFIAKQAVSTARLDVDEQSIQVVRELCNTEVTAPAEARFECELSMPVIRPPQWSLNGETLQNGKGVRIENFGKVHRLILKKTSESMSGQVKFTAGKARSKAHLSVRDPY